MGNKGGGGVLIGRRWDKQKVIPFRRGKDYGGQHCKSCEAFLVLYAIYQAGRFLYYELLIHGCMGRGRIGWNGMEWNMTVHTCLHFVLVRIFHVKCSCDCSSNDIVQMTMVPS